MKKVLMMHSQMSMYGGAELLVVRLARYLQEHNNKVTIATLASKDIDAYKGLEIITPQHQIEYRLRGSLSALKDVYEMWRELSNLCYKLVPSYDVINVHNFPSIWCVPSNKKVVWMCNEVPDLFHNRHISSLINPLLNSGRWIDRTVARSKHPIVVVSDESMARIFSHRYLIKPEIIPYGIDGEFFASGKKVGHTNFTIIQAAMVSPSKNQLAVLETARVLKSTIPNLQIIFAGYMEPNNVYTHVLKDYIKEHSLNVTFTGLISREYLRELYYSADVAVFPGVGQGSWLGPFEAMAASVPVIVSPKLTCSSLISREMLGTVNEDFVTAIKKIYTQPPSTTKAKQFILQNLTWEKFCSEFEKLL